MIDLDTVAALGRTVGERPRGPGLAPVSDRQWAANFRHKHKMGCLKKITTERVPSTVSDLALDNKWRREFLNLVAQPQKYGVRIPECEPQSLPAWAQLGLDETPLQYALKLRGRYAAREQQVRHYNSADKRQATATPTPVVNHEGSVKLLQVLHRGKTSCCHAGLDLPRGLPSYMHEDHAKKKCQTGNTFKRLMIKVDTEGVKDTSDHRVAQNYQCVVIMDWGGSHPDDDELKRVDDAEMKVGQLILFCGAATHICFLWPRLSQPCQHCWRSGHQSRLVPVRTLKWLYNSKRSSIQHWSMVARSPPPTSMGEHPYPVPPSRRPRRGTGYTPSCEHRRSPPLRGST